MRVLHFYQKQNDLQARYVSMLTETMGRSVEVRACHSLPEIRNELSSQHYDILHIHGCWSVKYAQAAASAKRAGTRYVISPHGELEPWILRDRQWQEKMPKTILYQRQTIQGAYAVIAMGSMEHESLVELGWNSRIETIRNAVITHSITDNEMTRQLLDAYRKVMDSNVYELMNEKTRHVLILLLKAGCCGNKNWLNGEQLPELNNNEWRQVLIYAQHEQVEDFLKHGIHVLGIKEPMIEVINVKAYFPENYRPVKCISEAIGNQYVSENKRLMATFKFLHRQHTSRQLAMAHLLELSREIREHDINEEHLAEMLEEEHLLTFTSRLMGTLADFGLMEEGIMPIHAVIDRQTERLKEMIINRLKI